MALAVAVEPDLGRAAAVDDVIELLIKMLLGIEGAARRHLDDIAAPFALGAEELDVAAAPAKTAPFGERQVLHLADADVAIDRDALALHELVVGRGGTAEFAVAGFPAAGRLVPMNLAGGIVWHSNLAK